MAVERLAIFEFYKLGRCVSDPLGTVFGKRDQALGGLTIGLFWAAVSSDSGSCRMRDEEQG